mmetsp:Transcript_28408/g.35670  ORF Transcript_28408/g.35670 Transcript_28408/m.35670 type:complete len:229 (+) Transcript_28408:116-802(+)
MTKIFRYCKYNRKGKCRFGSSCKYLHDKSVMIICPWFLKGECAHGSNCDYLHITAKEMHEFSEYKEKMEEKFQGLSKKVENLEQLLTQEQQKKNENCLAHTKEESCMKSCTEEKETFRQSKPTDLDAKLPTEINSDPQYHPPRRRSSRFKVGQLVEIKDYDKKWYYAVIKKIDHNFYQIRTFNESLYRKGRIHADAGITIRHPTKMLEEEKIEELRQLPHEYTPKVRW